MEEIKEGDIVRIKGTEKRGIVTAIIDYGTHVCYFVDTGELIKFPAKREWIEPDNTPEEATIDPRACRVPTDDDKPQPKEELWH